MYCEARTSTGLGCDSLYIAQCIGCAMVQRNEAYQAGLFGPRYPVPVTALDNMLVHKYDYNADYFERWTDYVFQSL